MPAVRIDEVTAVNGQLLVGVDGNQDDATVGVDGVGLEEPDLKIVQDCSVCAVWVRVWCVCVGDGVMSVCVGEGVHE